MTVFIICATVMMASLFGGSGESLDMKKCPPALLLAFFKIGWRRQFALLGSCRWIGRRRFHRGVL